MGIINQIRARIIYRKLIAECNAELKKTSERIREIILVDYYRRKIASSHVNMFRYEEDSPMYDFWFNAYLGFKNRLAMLINK